MVLSTEEHIFLISTHGQCIQVLNLDIANIAIPESILRCCQETFKVPSIKLQRYDSHTYNEMWQQYQSYYEVIFKYNKIYIYIRYIQVAYWGHHTKDMKDNLGHTIQHFLRLQRENNLFYPVGLENLMLSFLNIVICSWYLVSSKHEHYQQGHQTV